MCMYGMAGWWNHIWLVASSTSLLSCGWDKTTSGPHWPAPPPHAAPQEHPTSSNKNSPLSHWTKWLVHPHDRCDCMHSNPHAWTETVVDVVCDAFGVVCDDGAYRFCGHRPYYHPCLLNNSRRRKESISIEMASTYIAKDHTTVTCRSHSMR